MKFKNILFAALFLLFISEVTPIKNECQYWEFEEHIGSIFGHFSLPEYDWPEEEEDMAIWCNTVKKEKKEVDRFLKNCTYGLARTIGSIVTFSGAKLCKLACSNQNERQKYIERGKCGNEGKIESLDCVNELKNIWSNIQLFPNPKDKIPTLCCAYEHYKTCVINSYKAIARTICSEKNIAQIAGHLDRLDELPSATLCSNYKKPEICANYIPLFNTTANVNQYRTVFPAMIGVLESI